MQNKDEQPSPASPLPTEAWDVVVMGGGAAGLLAAATSAQRGRKTLLLEKNRRPGIKILMSGGTRCNITHATDNRGIVTAYGAQGKFLHSALAALSVQQTIDLFEFEGVPTKVEEFDKIFPQSDQASDVLAALLRRLERSGATLALDEPALDVRLFSPESGDAQLFVGQPRDHAAEPPRLKITTSKRRLLAQSAILTTGGKSYPGSGTCGDGYRFAAQLGHSIVTPRAALAPLRIREAWVHDLKGVTLAKVFVRALQGNTELSHRQGPLLFAHFGLTGPVALDISRAFSFEPPRPDWRLEIDFLPDVPRQKLTEAVRKATADFGKRQASSLLVDLLPRRLADLLLVRADISAETKLAELGKAKQLQLINSIKQLSLTVEGTLGFKKAEVTAGGIDLAEVDSKSMQSKRVPGLFLAGEVLDLDGPIGGYNFQAAFSTGHLAGLHA